MMLSIGPTLEDRLRRQASHHGVPAEEYAVRLLERSLADDRAQAAVALIQSWIDEGDEEEQRETGDYLVRALDEDRLSDRRLFP